MRILFLFMDGVGLGVDDPQVNPFAVAHMPAMQELLGGRKLLAAAVPFAGRRASLQALDARLGVQGLPQSATGQAVLLTGANIPAEVGRHYGPKPDSNVAAAMARRDLFSRLIEAGKRAAFLNAFPPGYFHGVASGRRLYAAIALAAVRAGVPLRTLDDLRSGQAVSADFTGEGLRQRLGISDIPVIPPGEAGRRMAELSAGFDFSLFEYWLSDYAGHGQDMEAAVSLLEILDQVMAGLLGHWNDQEGLIVITSDHGNLEDLSTRRHTPNPVPVLLIGGLPARESFMQGLYDLTGIAPAILRTLFDKDEVERGS